MPSIFFLLNLSSLFLFQNHHHFQLQQQQTAPPASPGAPSPPRPPPTWAGKPSLAPSTSSTSGATSVPARAFRVKSPRSCRRTCTRRPRRCSSSARNPLGAPLEFLFSFFFFLFLICSSGFFFFVWFFVVCFFPSYCCRLLPFSLSLFSSLSLALSLSPPPKTYSF